MSEVDSNTAVYVGNSFFKLSNPRDLLLFTPLSLFARFRLGVATLLIKYISNWKKLENITAVDWLEKFYGKEVSNIIWAPLLRGKFGNHWKSVSAVWMWNKLKLRGGSRKKGKEKLLYLVGGFEVLILRLAECICSSGGNIHLNSAVEKLSKKNDGSYIITSGGKEANFDHVIFTIPLPHVAEICDNILSSEVKDTYLSFKYLSNVCIVLKTKKPLTEHYWVNVNDPTFPFVAIIEHTNFQPSDAYGGFNLVYLSKYCDTSDELYQMSDLDVSKFTDNCLTRMFPDFDHCNIVDHFVWRADYSQPIVEKNYSQMLKRVKNLPEGLHVASMALIYPEDRGTNYAVREGLKVAESIKSKNAEAG